MESTDQAVSEQGWLSLWQQLGAHGDGAPIWAELRARYSEPHRAYHNLAHLRHCFAEWQPVRSLSVRPEAIEMALWFHDAIYDTHAADNEERSATLAVAMLKLAALADDFIAHVSDLILATKHSVPPTNPEAELLVDIDLAILGQPAGRFEEYERQIQREYDWVPDMTFRTKRAEVLRNFLQRPTIYQTPFFQTKYEAAARDNLRHSLAQLAG